MNVNVLGPNLILNSKIFFCSENMFANSGGNWWAEQATGCRGHMSLQQLEVSLPGNGEEVRGSAHHRTKESRC